MINSGLLAFRLNILVVKSFFRSSEIYSTQLGFSHLSNKVLTPEYPYAEKMYLIKNSGLI